MHWPIARYRLPTTLLSFRTNCGYAQASGLWVLVVGSDFSFFTYLHASLEYTALYFEEAHVSLS